MVDQLTLQPFFDSLGQASAPHAPAVNAAATARIERILKSPVDAPGRGILLRAPRAGFGKTHLLSYIQQRLGTTHEFLPLNPVDGSRTDPSAAIEAALRRLTRPLPAGGGLTDLDLQARRLFSLALQPLVNSGEVPCQDREAALSALRQRPVETFDFHHSQAVTAHWTKENFEVLGPRLALELSRRTGTSLNESSFWLASLFRFAVAVPEHPGRTGMIIQSATADAGVERYAGLLALLTLIGRVVVAADDLEGMHAEPVAALRFASFIATVRQEAPRVDVIVSINDDIWESAFVPALSGGLQDRLAEVEVNLEPLDEAGTLALLETRMPGKSAALGGKLGLSSGEFYARRVLRKAAQLEEERQDALPAAVPVQVTPPPLLETPAAAPADSSFGISRDAEFSEPVVSLPRAIPEKTPLGVVRRAAPKDAFSEPLDEIPEIHQRAQVPPPLAAVEAEEAAVPVAAQPEPEPEVESVSPFRAVEITPEPEHEPQAFEAEASPFQAIEAKPEPAKFEPGSSPFQVAEPEPAPREEPEAVTTTPGGDRIDDLLRQFRERYGRE